MDSTKFAAAIHPGYAAFVFTLFATLGFASAPLPTSTPEAPPSASAKERENAAQKFVDQALQTWQQRLNLKDWTIQVELVHPSKLEPKTLGNVHWDTDTRHATIGVLSSYDYQLPYQEMLDDMEFTVVHELVHIELASLPRSDASRRIEEHAVNELASALLKLAKHQ
jgi:hypothetical protein